MIKIIKIHLILLVSAFAMVSCMKDDETESAPECAILTFSVGDIKSYVTYYTSSGSTTTLTKTVSGSSIKFNIDQVNGIISTVDSVTNWINLKKVVPTFTCYGSVHDLSGYEWTSGSDSINFENPVTVYVQATDEISRKYYTIYFKKSNYSNDTITWNNVTNNFNVSDDFKTIEFKDSIYAFFKNTSGKVQVTRTAEKAGLSNWTTPQNIEGADINYSSVLTFNNNFYALGNDGCIYKINRDANSYKTEKASDKVFTQLLASDAFYIYATDGTAILGSNDFNTWNSCGTENINMLPTNSYSSFSYTSKTNNTIQICMMNGLTDKNTANGVSWYKVSSNDKDINQNWNYIQITGDNPYGLPKFKEMSTAMLNGSLYAIGTATDGSFKNNIYKSDDNGITWQEKSIYPLPKDINATNGSAKLVSANGNLWIIQKGGKIWSGVIR